MPKLRFSVLLTNWRRQKNIPNIIDRWAAQDYPKTNFEIVIIDANSPNKREVFDIVRDVFLAHPDLDVRFFETYESVTYNPSLRYNIGARKAKHEVLVFNESDVLVQGRDYLNICNEEHVEDEKLWLSPRIFSWRQDPAELVEEERSKMGHCTDLGGSVRRGNYHDAGGCDENIKGWGHVETELTHRLEMVGVHEELHSDLIAWHCEWNCMGFSNLPGPGKGQPYDPTKHHAGPSGPDEERRTWLDKEIERDPGEWGLLDTLKELTLEDLLNGESREH